MLQTQSLKFGWTKENPPDYKITLSKSDFSDYPALIPNDKFINRITKKLVGEANSTPRFAFIENAKPFLRSTKRLQEFQEQLMIALTIKMKTKHPELLKPWTGLAALSKQFPTVGEGISVKGWDTTAEFKSESDQANEYLHWDYNFWPFVSFSYSPVQNLIEPRTRLTDARQLARDRNKTISDIMNKQDLKKLGNTWLLKRFKKRSLIEKYSIELDNNGITLINNVFEAGILHGPKRFERRDKSRGVKRTIHHVAQQMPVNDPAILIDAKQEKN